MSLYTQLTPEKDTAGGAAGSSNAAQLLVALRGRVTVFYDVAASTDAIKIEGRTADGTWRELDETVASGSVATGGDTVDVTTGYEEVRAYAGSSFADSDVNDIEITARGL